MEKNFFASCMISEDVRTKLYTGYFFDGEDKAAEIHDGALVVRGEMLDHDVFDGVKDPNKYKITAPAAATAPVDVVDYVDVSGGNIMGVRYREGIKTFGLVCPAGFPTRVRILGKWDTAYWAEGNFASTPTVGEYAIPTANDTVWTPVSAIDTAKTCIKIEFVKDVIEGQANTGKEYFCTVVNVVD